MLYPTQRSQQAGEAARSLPSRWIAVGRVVLAAAGNLGVAGSAGGEFFNAGDIGATDIQIGAWRSTNLGVLQSVANTMIYGGSLTNGATGQINAGAYCSAGDARCANFILSNNQQATSVLTTAASLGYLEMPGPGTVRGGSSAQNRSRGAANAQGDIPPANSTSDLSHTSTGVKQGGTVELFTDSRGPQVSGAAGVGPNTPNAVATDARSMPNIPSNSQATVVANNPYIPPGPGVQPTMMEFLPEAVRIAQPGGQIVVNGTAANPYVLCRRFLGHCSEQLSRKHRERSNSDGWTL